MVPCHTGPRQILLEAMRTRRLMEHPSGGQVTLQTGDEGEGGRPDGLREASGLHQARPTSPCDPCDDLPHPTIQRLPYARTAPRCDGASQYPVRSAGQSGPLPHRGAAVT